MESSTLIEDLGSYLKTIREENKISVAHMAQELKTRTDLIQALEANNFDKFPAPAYVKGFLISYSKYFNLDPEVIVASFNKKYTKQAEQVIVLESKKMGSAGIKITKLKAIIFICILFLAILLLSSGIMLIFGLNKSKTSPKGKEIQPVKTEQPAVVVPPIKEQVEPAEPSAPANLAVTTPITLDAHTSDNVWMRVYADKKLIFEGILTQGEKKTWKSDKEFKLRIGNPAKLNLTLNGTPIDKVAPYGPVNVVINEKGIHTEK